MHIYQPYTYLIGWSHLDRWYYGVRFAKKCHPSDLFNPYQTSSKYVKAFIKENGHPNIIEVRKTFTDLETAVLWEQKVLRRLKVNLDDRWLNKTYNGCFTFKGVKNTIPGMLAAQTKIKGKKYEEWMNPDLIEAKKINSSIVSKRNWTDPIRRIKMLARCTGSSDAKKAAAKARWVAWHETHDSRRHPASGRTSSSYRRNPARSKGAGCLD